MKVKILTLSAILLTSSCSTLRKSKIYGGLAGAVLCGIVGAQIGKDRSPDKESVGLNKNIGMATGAAICGVGGYLLGKALYESDPRNFEDKPIDFENSKKEESKQAFLPTGNSGIDFSDLSIKQDSESRIPLVKGLPVELKGKIQRQKIIKYKVPAQTIKTKDGRLIHFNGGQAIEHRYENTKGN